MVGDRDDLGGGVESGAARRGDLTGIVPADWSPGYLLRCGHARRVAGLVGGRAGGRGVAWIRRAFRALPGRFRRAPVSVSMIALLWGLGAGTGSLWNGPQGAVGRWVGASVPNLSSGHLVMAVGSAFFASNLGNYLLGTVVWLVVGVVVEPRHSTRQILAVGVVIQVVAVLAGLLAVHVVDPLDESWNDALSASIAVTPLPGAVGLLLAHTACQSALWRRRVRLVGFGVLLMLAFYTGYLTNALTLSGAFVGLLVGEFRWRRPRVPSMFLRMSRREGRSLVAAIVAVTALGPLVVAWSPSAIGPLRVLRYMFTSPAVNGPGLREICVVPANANLCAELVSQNRFRGLGPAVHALLPALLVLVLAWGLAKGRRSAWWMTVVTHVLLLGLGIILALTSTSRGPGSFALLAHHQLAGVSGLLLPIVMPLAVLGLLIMGRSFFRVLPAPGTQRRLATTVGVAVVAAFLGYTGVGSVIDGQFTPQMDWAALARNFPLRLIPPGYLGFGLPRLAPLRWPGTVLIEWTGVAVWVVAFGAVVLSFRQNRRVGVEGDTERARKILTGTTGSALSYLTTWQGNQYWFSRSGTTYIAYRAHGGVAVTTTDPVGPLPERAAAIVEFCRFCDENGLSPCLYSVTEQTRSFTRTLGWQDLQVAEETVLDLGALAFRGRKFQDVRTAINRAARAGIIAQWISYPTATLSVTEQVQAISEEWVADKALPEMGFTLGGLDELDDPRVRCLIAIGDDARLHGIISWLPVYRNDMVVGWTLDFMRRAATGFPGVMEFLIGTAALGFQGEGAEFVSLSGAPLARTTGARAAGDSGQTSTMQRLLDQLGRTLEPVYGFKSLLAFKSKFQPLYRPLYMCYPDPVTLPRIAAAIGHAYLPHLSFGQLIRTAAKMSPGRPAPQTITTSDNKP